MKAWGFHVLHRVPVVQRPRTPPFHGDDTGSNPVGDANSFHLQLKPVCQSSAQKHRLMLSPFGLLPPSERHIHHLNGQRGNGMLPDRVGDRNGSRHRMNLIWLLHRVGRLKRGPMQRGNLCSVRSL